MPRCTPASTTSRGSTSSSAGCSAARPACTHGSESAKTRTQRAAQADRMFRADSIVTATYLVTLSAPIVVYGSLRDVRAGHHDAHRLIQAVHVIMCWLAVLGLELRIRFAGGSGAFLEMAPPALQGWATRLLAVHI